MWSDFIDHRFVRGIADGTLNRESFEHFIKQDYLYLQNYARAAALAAYKSKGTHNIGNIRKSLLTSGNSQGYRHDRSLCKHYSSYTPGDEASCGCKYDRLFLVFLCCHRINLPLLYTDSIAQYGGLASKIFWKLPRVFSILHTLDLSLTKVRFHNSHPINSYYYKLTILQVPLEMLWIYKLPWPHALLDMAKQGESCMMTRTQSEVRVAESSCPCFTST